MEMLKSHYKDIFENQDKHWWYLGMAEINKTLLDNCLPKKKNLKILDSGCGPGANLLYLRKYGEVIGIDLSDDALFFAKKRGKVIKSNVTKLSFDNNFFDLIVSTDVLYHMWVKDISKAVSEYERVLKKGGILLIREPAYNWMRGREDEESLTARRFSSGELIKVLKKNNFKINKISHVNFFLFPLALLVRLLAIIRLKRRSSDMVIPPMKLNNLFFNLLKLEAFLVKRVMLPYGSSLVCVVLKQYD